jgi:hypothetical protein
MYIIMSISDASISLIDPLLNFIEDGLCDQKILDKIKKLRYDEFEQIINILCDQVSIHKFKPKYSLYKIDIVSHKFEHLLNIDTQLHSSEYHTTIQSDMNSLVLHTLSPESFILYTTDNFNKKKRYIYIPMCFSINDLKHGHQTSLIVDTFDFKVYLYDPNGQSNYFNNIHALKYLKDLGVNFDKNNQDDQRLLHSMYFDGTELVDKLLCGYFKIISDMIGVKYTYIPQDLWNPFNKTLNPKFNNSLIDSGHCVITTILILHYLHISQSDVTTIYTAFTNLSEDDLLYIINGYTLGIYNNIIQYQ